MAVSSYAISKKMSLNIFKFFFGVIVMPCSILHITFFCNSILCPTLTFLDCAGVHSSAIDLWVLYNFCLIIVVICPTVDYVVVVSDFMADYVIAGLGICPPAFCISVLFNVFSFA